MGIVGLEHDVVAPNSREQFDAHCILEEAAVDLPVVVRRRPLGTMQLAVAPTAVRFPDVVEPFEQSEPDRDGPSHAVCFPNVN